MLSTRLYLFGLALLLSGLVLITVGSFQGGNVSAGGFVLIGPFPIVFGSGKYGGLLAVLSVVAGFVMLVMVYVALRGARAGRTQERTSGEIL